MSRRPRPSFRRVVARGLEVLRVLARHRREAFVQRTFLSRWIVHTPMTGSERLRAGLEELGGSFVKLGQLLAMQRELLSEETCRALFDLLDRTTPVAFDELAEVYRADQGRGLEESFDRVDREPLASASIAQVHRAWRGGRAWAVKIRRPGAEAVFARDLAVMVWLARWIRRLRVRSWGRIADALEEFVDWTRNELDFRWEARFAAEIRRTSSRRRCRIPRVDPERSGRRVLTAELLDGPTLVAHFRRPEVGWSVPGFDPDLLATHIVETFLVDAFEHGIFHADLHPGNLLVLPNSLPGYVDFGIVGRLSGHARRHLVGITLAYARGDVEDMLRQFEQLAWVESERDLVRFRDGLRALSEKWFRHAGGRLVATRRFPLVMLEMTRLSRQTGVWPHREVVLYMRSVVAADGLIARLAPGYDLEARIRELAGDLLARRNLLELTRPERLLRPLVASPPPPNPVGAPPARASVRLLAVAAAVLVAAAGLDGAAPELATVAYLTLGGLGLGGLLLETLRP